MYPISQTHSVNPAMITQTPPCSHETPAGTITIIIQKGIYEYLDGARHTSCALGSRSLSDCLPNLCRNIPVPVHILQRLLNLPLEPERAH